MRIVGALSGTSVDGIDVVVADFLFCESEEDAKKSPLRGVLPDGRHFTLTQVAYDTVSWSPSLREHVLYLCTGVGTVREVCVANFSVGEEFSQAILQVLERKNIKKESVDLIGSHGQTIWHEVVSAPLPSSSSPSLTHDRVIGTLQIGEAAMIAERTGVTVVSNFRARDVSAGGHGAPLTSTFDWMMLRGSGWRALQNVGGIGNVTLLPPHGADDSLSLAFDTGPGNTLLDWVISDATEGREKYDKDGQRASTGKVNQTLLSEWLSHPYFSKQPPKTTGREIFGAQFAKQCKERAKALLGSDMPLVDLLATLTELTARSIALSYSLALKDKIPKGERLEHVIVSGGGARNAFLMSRIKYCTCEELGYDVRVTDHEAIGVDSDAKGNVPSCTGAKGPRVLGTITPGDNFPQLYSQRSVPSSRH